MFWYIKMRQKLINPLAFMILVVTFCLNAADSQSVWIEIDSGLHYGEFKAPIRSDTGDSIIFVLKVDPNEYDFSLFSASQHTKGLALNVREWVERYGLVGAINAGMFQKDRTSNVGYMKNFTHFNNPRIHKTYASVFAFNPRKPGLPAAYVFDTDVDDMKEIIAGYHTVIQNLRLIRRPKINRWSRQDKKWSEAALGQDADGNILLIFSESPYSMHDLGNVLLELPINIVCAQHLEGGASASFYLRHNATEIRKSGIYKTSSVVGNTEGTLSPIPNVIGIKKKADKK